MRVALALLLTVVLGPGLIGCRGEDPREQARSARERAILELVPALDPELARQLAAHDSAAWSAFAERSGPRPFMDASITVYRAFNARSRGEFLRDRDRLSELQARIVAVLETRFDYRAPADYARLLASFPAERDHEVHAINLAYARTWSDSAIGPAERLARLDALITAAAAAGDPYMAMNIRFSAARMELEMGRFERYRARLDSVLADARRFEDPYLECQALGELVVSQRQGAATDSVLAFVDRGLTLARRHRFPDQAGRFLHILAQSAIGQRRFALAAERIAESLRLCEAFGGGSSRVRLTLDLARYLAYLGSWDLVESTLRMLPPLLREFPSAVERDAALKYALDADELRARAAFARGDVANGSARMRDIVERTPSWNRRGGLANAHLYWSAGLLRHGLATEALQVADRGLAHCDSAHVPEIGVSLALRRARSLEHIGALDEARAALEDAERRALAGGYSSLRGEYGYRVLDARIRIGRGQRDSGIRTLRRVFEERRRDPGAGGPTRREGDVGLSERDAVHALAGLHPEQGYGFELEWRSRMRRSHPDGRSGQDPFASRRPRAGVHVVFAFHDGRLLRWTARPAGVELDTLPLSPWECQARVREVVGHLRSEPVPAGAWYGPRTTAALERLSRLLLPGDLELPETEAVRVEITPDGPLAALPFEALFAPGHAAVPLGFVADVAYGFGWRARSGAAVGPAMVFVSPAPSASIRRRHPGASPISGAEVALACSLWGGVPALRGERATKAGFVHSARLAPRLYVAGHHLRNPSLPLLGYLPMSTAPGASTEEAVLEASDIRELDLSGCRLAVLATCASGAPYLHSVQSGPTLGDAFLDAGTHAVVTSFWDVEDEETARFMRRFLIRYEETGDPARALRLARRDGLQAAEPVSPRAWAAWSVAVTHERSVTAERSFADAGVAGRHLRAPKSSR